MFEHGQKCYTFKECVTSCAKPKNRKFRYDIVECTVQTMSFDQKSVLITWCPNPGQPWTEHCKLELHQVFVSEDAAKNHLEEQKQIKKAELPRVGDLVGFMSYESLDTMNSGYVFRTSCVVKASKTSVHVVRVNENKEGPTQYVGMGSLVILQRALPKTTKGKKKNNDT